jgi:hypothetical protein
VKHDEADEGTPRRGRRQLRGLDCPALALDQCKQALVQLRAAKVVCFRRPIVTTSAVVIPRMSRRAPVHPRRVAQVSTAPARSGCQRTAPPKVGTHRQPIRRCAHTAGAWRH